ncbi:hypothetical protein [Paralcaligenes ureilyticus]|uniref:Uncharacterized protein n=1 Tax=Paralcaligenes ureilyticus TaxID=627131 RepID=A0A4R3MB41_9BURK|nr:hypothetical protein [Paralcaligenes ureilyticus]TCT09479.1 hypothetical protein EDC26_10397 [Paralcaligenes ureilyticus]
MKDSFSDLKIELIEDGIGDGLIVLEQDSSDNIGSITIHPVHLRYMAEKFGLVQTSDPQAQKTIATLTRRLCLLRDRIDHLADWLATYSDSRHADLTYEQTYAWATAEMADEFCEDFPEQGTEASGKPSPAAIAGQRQLAINADAK